jgi:hypothetical protein
MSRYDALSLYIDQELASIARAVERVSVVSAKAIETGDDDFWGTVALEMHSFYLGNERIFERIARDLDNSVPRGRGWHRDLLQQMAGELPDIRPALISHESWLCVDDYRRFRHVLQHGYAAKLDIKRVHELAVALPACYDLLERDFSAFRAFLRSVNGSDT